MRGSVRRASSGITSCIALIASRMEIIKGMRFIPSSERVVDATAET